MSRRLTSILVFAASLVSLHPAHAGEPASPWSTSGEVLYMWRDDTQTFAFTVADPVLAPGERVFNSGNLENDEGWGGALRISYRLSPSQSAWLRGFYGGEFGGSDFEFAVPSTKASGQSSTTYSVNPNTGILTNNTLGGYTAFFSQQESHLWGLEASYQQKFSSPDAANMSFYGGPRYIRFVDKLNMKFAEDPNDVKGPDIETQTLSIDLANNLIGAQLGVAIDQPLTSVLSFNGTAAIGLFANYVQRDRLFREDEIGVTVIDDSDSETNFAWALEFSAGLTWHVAQNVSVDVGYRGIYLGDVATAAAQFEDVSTAGAGTHANSDVWIHGVRAGGTIGF